MTTSRFWRHGRPVVGGLLLSLYLFVLVVAQSAALHEACHEDADQPDHQCAVTLISSGLIDAVSVEVAVVAGPAIAREIFPGEFLPPGSPDFLLLPGRGPPALLS